VGLPAGRAGEIFGNLRAKGEGKRAPEFRHGLLSVELSSRIGQRVRSGFVRCDEGGQDV
jgi:hypothetical protein